MRRIRVRGEQRDEVDQEQIALVYWLQAKRQLRERREREAAAKAKGKNQRGVR